MPRYNLQRGKTPVVENVSWTLLLTVALVLLSAFVLVKSFVMPPSFFKNREKAEEMKKRMPPKTPQSAG